MHKTFLRHSATTFITLVCIGAPLLASAQTTTSTSTAISNIQSQIQSLLTQLSSLRQQLSQLTGVVGDATPNNTMASSSCPMIIRDLQLGAQGDDVRQLQDFLARESNIFNASSTGFFGPRTQQAVQEFQRRNGIASSSTGFVGARTRTFLQGRCGSGHGGEQVDNQQRISSTTPIRPMGDDHRPFPQIGSTTMSQFPHEGTGSTTMWWINASTTPVIHDGDNGGDHGGPRPPVPPPVLQGSH